MKQLRAQIEDTTSDYDREKLQERLAKLVGGVAIIKVGAVTESEMKERKARVEDAMHATKAAVEEGIVPGGGVALLRAAATLSTLTLDGDEQAGVRIIARAVEAPLRWIANNAGLEGSVVVERVKSLTGQEGFNAQTEIYENLVQAGVIDPTKVVRSALQNAASVASLLLTTEAVVALMPDDHAGAYGMAADTVGIGILGFGGFAMFAAQQFAQVPGAALRCIAGTHREASLACAARFGLVDVQRAEALFAMPDVQLVYIATPPFLHYEQARDALRAGKHVIVEKPLAVTMEQADELVSLARDKRLLLVTNLMQRYNPLFGQIKALVDSKLLGDVLRGTFENYACDEGLGPDHWFWDRTKSGGIFIEHGVHFFDMFAGWLGERHASNRRGACCVPDRGSRSRSTARPATATCP